MVNQWYNLANCKKEFEKYEKSIVLDGNNIKNIYSIVKREAPNFYTDAVGFDLPYKYLKKELFLYELKMPKRFIIPSDPDLTFKTKDDNILDYIVYEARCALASKMNIPRDELHMFKQFELSNKCHDVSDIVKDICDKEGVCCKTILIYPGFDKESKLCGEYGFHYFNVVYVNNEAFLIDCSYRQFFTEKGNHLERIGIPFLQGAKPGVFMLMDEERKEVAKTLLKKGWIKLTNKVLKCYLDGFAISYRNGLYYEQAGDFSFTTEYTPDDYKNFLSGVDNQILHEGKDVLGYQKVLLKNPNISIKSQ